MGADVYLMWSLTTNIIHNSRDVIWLKRTYYPRIRDAPLINGANFFQIEVQEGIGVINTTTTENDTQDNKNDSEDEEYADLTDLAVKPRIECDSDEESDDEENNDDNDDLQ